MLYRMVSVVGPLRCKPLMQGHDKGRVLGAVANLCPIWERGVLDIDVLGTRLQCGQAWHVLPVNFCWIREMVVLEKNNGHLRQLSAEGPPLFRALLASPRE